MTESRDPQPGPSALRRAGSTIALFFALATLAATSLVPASAHARMEDSPFRVRLELDLPIIATTTLGALLPELLKGRLAGPPCLPSCDASSVLSLDRFATTLHSDVASRVSDVTVGALIALPLLLGALDVAFNKPSDGWRGFMTDALVVSETLTIEFALAALARFGVRRPRPLVYNETLPLAARGGADNTLSFFSGHAGSAFAMAVATSLIYAKRHPRSPWRAAVWAGSLAFAALTAALRVVAGRHFLTDALVGSAVGAGVGFVVPWLHLRPERAP